MNTSIHKIYKHAFAIALIALVAACSGSTPATAPGTATPEGGNQPGVEITLTRPIIALSGITGGTATRTDIDVANIRSITLYTDLLTSVGAVSRSALYTYTTPLGSNSGTWTATTTALTVTGGAGKYHMRAGAVVTLNDLTQMLVYYTGTGTVKTDGTFTFDGSLKPYDTKISVNLKDANGKPLKSGNTDADIYTVYLRGVAKMKESVNADNSTLNWTPDNTLPASSAVSGYASQVVGTDGVIDAFSCLMHGDAPAEWSADDVTWGRTTILLTVYKGVKSIDEGTKLPTADAKSWHAIPTGKYTLKPGHHYTFTVVLNRADLHITEVTVNSLDFEADGGGNIIIS